MREFWEKTYRRFDPQEPPREPAWIAQRPGSPVVSIARAIARPFEPPHFLLASTPGVGTTTELMRLQRQLSGEEQLLPIFVDLVRHFSDSVRDEGALQSIAPHEVLLLGALAIVRGATEAFEHRWDDLPSKDKLTRLDRAWREISDEEPAKDPTLNVLELASQLLATVVDTAGVPLSGTIGELLTNAGKTAAKVKWTVRLGRNESVLTDQDERSQGLLSAVNDLILYLEHAYKRRIVLIIDGLDRITEVAVAERLFLSSQLIGQLRSSLVLAAPFVLRHSLANPGIRSFKFKVLTNAQVLAPQAPEDPTQTGAEVDFLYELFCLRTKDLADHATAIHDGAMAHLIRYSGGRVRDFVRLVRDAAARAWDADAPQIDMELAEEAVDELRKEYENAVNRRHIEILRGVLDDPEHRLPDDPETPDLLKYFRLLPYANGNEWYYPHPLLTLKLLIRP